MKYETLNQKEKIIGPINVVSNIVNDESVVNGVSNYTVLRSSTMLYLSQSLKDIANIYYNTNVKISEVNQLKAVIWDKKYPSGSNLEYDQEKSEYESITNEEIQNYENEIDISLKEALSKTIETRKILINTKSMLANIGFDDEILILDNYLKTLGTELKLAENDVSELKQGIELTSIGKERSLNSYIESLFKEINLSLNSKEDINLVISPFLYNDNENSGLRDLLNQNAIVALSSNNKIKILERSNLEDILSEQELTLSGLVDINQAITVGELLSAQYIITGNIIPMKDTVLVFARVVNVESSEIETVTRVIIPKTEEVIGLL